MDKKVLKNTALIAGVALVFAAVCLLAWGMRRSFSGFSPAGVREYIRGFGKMGALIYVLAYAANTVSVVPPIAVLSLAAGLAFGKIPGAALLMSGAMLGTSLTFFISRYFGRAFVEKRLKDRFKKLDDLLGKKGFAAVLFFRVIPLVPFEALNYACGLTKIKFRDYFCATFLGFIPGVAVAAFFGGELGNARAFRDLANLRFALALAILALVFMAPVIYLKLKKRRGVNGGKL